MDTLLAFSQFRVKCKESLKFLNETLANDQGQSEIVSTDQDMNASTMQKNEIPMQCLSDAKFSILSDQSQIIDMYDSYAVDDALEHTVSSYFISDIDPSIESNFGIVNETSVSSFRSNNSPENVPKAVVSFVSNAKPKTECPDCGAFVVNCRKHMETHKSGVDRKKPYVCELCQRAYINRPSYIGHINKHKNIRPYACGKCDKTFHGAANLRMHMNSHGTTRKFQCSECTKSFRYCHDLATHRRIHTQHPIYACDQCNYKNVKLQYVKRHALIHNSFYRFTCEHCLKGFNRKEYYRNHIQNNRCQRDEVVPT